MLLTGPQIMALMRMTIEAQTGNTIEIMDRNHEGVLFVRLNQHVVISKQGVDEMVIEDWKLPPHGGAEQTGRRAVKPVQDQVEA